MVTESSLLKRTELKGAEHRVGRQVKTGKGPKTSRRRKEAEVKIKIYILDSMRVRI